MSINFSASFKEAVLCSKLLVFPCTVNTFWQRGGDCVDDVAGAFPSQVCCLLSTLFHKRTNQFWFVLGALVWWHRN